MPRSSWKTTPYDPPGHLRDGRSFLGNIDPLDGQIDADARLHLGGEAAQILLHADGAHLPQIRHRHRVDGVVVAALRPQELPLAGQHRQQVAALGLEFGCRQDHENPPSVDERFSSPRYEPSRTIYFRDGQAKWSETPAVI